MQKEEKLRRRDPKAHSAMVLARRERELRSIQQYAPLPKPPPAASIRPTTSTQQIRWDAPMIATGDMLRLPSTAPDVTLGTESMPDAPLVISHSVASPKLHDPESGFMSFSALETGEVASVPNPKQTQTSLDVPQRLCGTPKFTTHDLQNHIDNSVTTLTNNPIAQQEEALTKAICDLFGEGSLDRSQKNKGLGLVSQALQKATQEEFQSIISRKYSESEYDHMNDSVQLLYAHELQNFIVQKAKSEEDHRHLASGVKQLLDKESINPKTLLKFLGDTLLSSQSDAATNDMGERIQPDHIVSAQPEPIHGQTEHESSRHQSSSGPINGFNDYKTQVSGTTNNSEENKGERKRSATASDEHPKKKLKAAAASTPNLPSSKPMGKMFGDLLRREATRFSHGRP